MSLLHLSLRGRLGVLVAAAVLSLLGVAAAGWCGLKSAAEASERVMGRHVPAITVLGDLRAAVGNLRRFEKDMMLHTGDPNAMDKYQARWTAAMGDAQRLLKALDPLIEADQQPDLRAVGEGLDGYARGFEGIAARLFKGEFADPTIANQAMEPLKGDVRKLDEKLAAVGKGVTQSVAEEQAVIQALRRQQAMLQAVGLALGSGVVALVAWAIVRSITAPLARASEALDRLAAGDLSRPVAVQGHDELAHMMRRLADTQQSLRALVHTIQEQARSVAAAGTQIAQGNGDLSARTERQAASLQQTAASMEQLVAAVRDGAGQATQASELAREATRSAEQGGDVVGRVVQTMSDLQATSRQIADITGVIDGIAFQTNILALNAAVEAARAGEQGRGFAVVASEVRMLAQRSAEAARQIKGLIAASTERVELGHQLVHSAGGTIQAVVAQVRQVSGMMSEVSSSADRQRDGIDQVGQVVSELDQVTQQNAAMVEQSAAAAASLDRQSRQLAEAVRAFRLETAA